MKRLKKSNNMSELCLSICIPTNGRIEILKNTLNSIYNDCKVPFSRFEVVISDNSTDDELMMLLNSYKQFPNIVYHKTDCEGFLNSINALKNGKGQLLKLHNNYTMFRTNGLEELVSFINDEKQQQPLIFFKNSGTEKIKSYSSFDLFSYDLSFWNSWSSGFSIWKDDFDKISKIEVNKMFPHTSLLLGQHFKKVFKINSLDYFVNQEVNKKGGYNLFKTFAVDYISIMKDCKANGYISEATFKKIKKDLFYRFLITWYYNTKLVQNYYTFSLDGIRASLTVYYGSFGYYKLIFWSYIYFLKQKLKFENEKKRK